MMTAKDLNLNALPDEFEENYEYSAPSDRIESGTDIAKRVNFDSLYLRHLLCFS